MAKACGASLTRKASATPTASASRSSAVVVQQGGQGKPLAEGLLGYVLPGASMRWPAPVVPNAGSVIKGRVNGQEVAEAIRQGQ